MGWRASLLHAYPGENRILRYDPKTGAIAEWRTGTNRTNGLAYDSQGRLFGCCSGGRSILRIDPDGRNVVIADRVEGKRLNTPNDLAIDRKGRIWFTNPVNEGNWDKTEVMELDNQSVLRSDPQKDGSYTVTRVTFDTTMPNGILRIEGPEHAVRRGKRLRERHRARAARLSDPRRRQPRHLYDALYLGRGCQGRASRHRRHVPGRGWQYRRHQRLGGERTGADDLPCSRPRAACWRRTRCRGTARPTAASAARI